MPKPHDEDLFENTKMTFGEHLEELRVALFKSLIAIVVGFLLGLLFAKHVVVWIQGPLEEALVEYYKNVDEGKRAALIERLKEEGASIPSFLQREEDADAEMQFEEVYIDPEELLAELRKLYPGQLPRSKPSGESPPSNATNPRLLRIVIGRTATDEERTQTKSFSVHEPFMIYVKAALLTGALVSSPLVFFFIWQFVAAGLYPHERQYVHVFMPFSLGLFLAGAALAFFVVFRFVLAFLFSFNSWLGIDPDPRISEWLGFVIMLPLGFGISFQLPLVMLFLERIGVFSVQAYISKWRLAVLVVAVMSMLLTPADPTSMILMGVPLTLLYFGGILLCKLMPRRTSPFGQPV
ncbi:MAG: twin-arginine translocase subunit TatC [Pirellulales bacterium]